jgi:hypothetical protein
MTYDPFHDICRFDALDFIHCQTVQWAFLVTASLLLLELSDGLILQPMNPVIEPCLHDEEIKN